MTTPGPPGAPTSPSVEEPVQPGSRPGVDHDHLRSYEELRRSTADRKVAGVAGGLGRHLNVDPTILRVLLVVLCFFGGAGFLLYAVAWLIVPEDGRPEGTIATAPGLRNGVLVGTAAVAALLVVGHAWGGFGFPWPAVVVVGLGVLVYLAVRDRGASSTAGQPPAPTYGPDWGPQPGDEPTAAYAQQPSAPPWQPAGRPLAPRQPARPRTGPRLFGVTLAVVALALGSLGLYDVSGGHVVESAYPALALAVVGLMLVVGAFLGRAGGLILLGVLAALALAATSVSDTVGGLGGRGRQLSVIPTSAAGVRSDYAVGSGRVFLDLSEIRDPAALDGRVVQLSAGAGELVVVLPRGVTSEVDADIDGPGQIELPEDGTGGIDTSLDGTYGAGSATVTITAHLSAGHIDVRNP